MAIMNERLLSIQPPKTITRTPRPLHERKLWKASEWRSWLIFYVKFCLKDVLPHLYLSHFAILSNSIFELLQGSINYCNLEKIEVDLVKYVVLYQEYFGKKRMTYNIHLLLHIVDGIRNWGPLWTHNTFHFESCNRSIGCMIHSPNQILSQTSRRYLTAKKLDNFKLLNGRTTRFFEFCQELEGKKTKNVTKVKDFVLINPGKLRKLSALEEVLFGKSGMCTEFQKMIFHGIRYTSVDYRPYKKTKDCYIKTKTSVKGW